MLGDDALKLLLSGGFEQGGTNAMEFIVGLNPDIAIGTLTRTRFRCAVAK
jgi:hypothetical protein